MKKKIFTLLTLLVAVVMGAKAEDATVKYALTSGVVFTSGQTVQVKDAKNNVLATVTYGETGGADFKETKSGNQIDGYTAFTEGNGENGNKTGGTFYTIVPTVDASITIAVIINKDKTFIVEEDGTSIGSYSQESEKFYGTKQFDATANKSYKCYVSGSKLGFYGFEMTYEVVPTGPEITTQPQSANYVTGYAATALHVAATSSGGNLSYQWYRCDDANKSNSSAISGATTASYAPSTANAGTFYYYCVVTDDNGSTASNVATITVSAAAAPTISVSGAPVGDIATGTEVTLTATVTGNPAPTVKWFSNTNASTTGGTFTGETGETFSPSTATPGTYYYFAQAVNTEGNALSAVQTIVVKNQVATPTFDPNGSYFEDSKQVTISCTTEDATIHYSTDNGATWTAYTGVLVFTESTTLQAKATKDDYIDSETATATFTKVTLDTQVDVTAAATWDWSKFGTKEIKLTDTSTPSKTTEFVLSNVVNYGLCSSISSDFGNAQQLLVTTEYVVRDWKSDGSNGYMQGGYVKFNTTVPGTLSVRYANTGNRTDEDDRRFLNVNGINYGEGTMNSTMITTDGIAVAAGEVHIKGTLKKDGKDQYLRISKITFTPLTEGDVVSVTDAAYATHVLADDIDFTQSEGVTAYKAKVVGDNIQLIEVEQAPAGTPLVIAATKDVYTLQKATTTPAAVADNDLKAATTTIKQSDATPGNTIYVLNVKNDVVGFYKLSATGSLQAGKAYIEAPSSTSAREMFGFSFYEDATGIKAVENEKMNVENGEFFNLSGQRVAQPTKGLYIVNGKKVIK